MTINVGDRVRYSSEWCRNTGQVTGDIPFARGIVVSLKTISREPSSLTLAEVDWGDDEIPHRVNVVNLEKTNR